MLLAPPLCWTCRGPAGRGAALCASCRGRLRFAAGTATVGPSGLPVHAALSYEGPARDLVHALKFRAAAGLADTMAAFMVAAAPAGLLDAGCRLVPVPLHPRRRRRRGFNQAELLASALAARTDLAVSDCLARGGANVRQVGRGRDARLDSLAGSIAVRSGVPDHSVLVDDVVTTGSTIAECARVLRAAGAAELGAIVFARTPGR